MVFQDSSIRGGYITISGFLKQTAAILKLYFRFHFDVSVVIGMWFLVGVPIFFKSDHQRPSYDVIVISKMAATASQIYFQFLLWWRTAIKNVKVYCKLNFDNVAQSAAEILLFPVFWNKRPPYWNFTSGFHFNVFTVIGMWFCVGIPNFIQIGPSAAELWRHRDFQDGSRQPRWICCGAMVDHPRSVVDGCCYVLKFWLDRVYSFGDSVIFF